mmetsp:Transcript_92932/g.277344  ORF Transcript_92932/g.277344 Transcript_92932/m.277344 type:complete len:209 (+) Transcript_92932:73-699(+)
MHACAQTRAGKGTGRHVCHQAMLWNASGYLGKSFIGTCAPSSGRPTHEYTQKLVDLLLPPRNSQRRPGPCIARITGGALLTRLKPVSRVLVLLRFSRLRALLRRSGQPTKVRGVVEVAGTRPRAAAAAPVAGRTARGAAAAQPSGRRRRRTAAGPRRCARAPLGRRAGRRGRGAAATGGAGRGAVAGRRRGATRASGPAQNAPNKAGV